MSTARTPDGTPEDFGYSIRQKSAQGYPRPETNIERRCQECGASFVALAPGRTREVGIWREMRWWCSVECAGQK